MYSEIHQLKQIGLKKAVNAGVKWRFQHLSTATITLVDLFIFFPLCCIITPTDSYHLSADAGEARCSR